MTLIRLVDWSDEARHELPARANGRRLVVDDFASRCCGSKVSIGDLSVVWRREAGSTNDLVPIAAPDGIQAWVQPDLVPVLLAARGHVRMRGVGRWRHASVELDDGAVWLEFIGRSRPRSPLRH